MSIERMPSLIKSSSDWIFRLLSPEPSISFLISPSTPDTSSNDKVPVSDGHAKDDERTAVENAEISILKVAVEMALNIGLAILSSMLLSMLLRRALKGILPQSDPEVPEKKVYARLKRIRHKLGHDSPTPELSPREIQMADEILDPEDIESSFADIGGLDTVKQELYELAVLPLVRPDLFPASKLVQPVKGILLYGKPGTGKTMLAKSLAKEAEAIFLPLQLSKILNKYWGESNKLIAATFSLAHKIQPAVIFIDELDTFLKNSNSETAYMDSIKAEFLTLWDGIATVSTSRVLVLGATNKPQQIDPAILRRMPRAFEVPLPNSDGRLSILELLLKDENVDDTVKLFLPKLVQATVGYSGSDLKELCRAAAMIPIQERSAEFARRRVMGERDVADSTLGGGTEKMRCINEHDFLTGLQKVRRTGEAANRYGKEQEKEHLANQPKLGVGLDVTSLQNFAAMLQALSSMSATRKEDDEIPQV